MAGRDEAVRAAARRHGLSEGAIEALRDAFARGRGQAQFNHPDLGGMGQWSGGMLQIGEMFNTRLKAQVAAACADLALQAEKSGNEEAFALEGQRQQQGTRAPEALCSVAAPRTSVPRTGSASPTAGHERDQTSELIEWWPSHYGRPASSGSQNGTRYAYFPDRHRLVIHRDGRSTVYDTGRHRLSGVSQQQSRNCSLVFTSQGESLELEDFAETDD